MPTAFTFADSTIPGVALEGMRISARQLQFHDRKFWGVAGVSRIYGNFGLRTIEVPVLIYNTSGEPDISTARKLSDYIDYTINTTLVGHNGTLLITSESNHSSFVDVSFEGADLFEGPKHDEAGTLGGGYWAIV